jgi:hypothetical protein
MPRDHPGVGIVAAAGRAKNHQTNLLALVKIFSPRRCAADTERKEHDKYWSEWFSHKSLLSGISTDKYLPMLASPDFAAEFDDDVFITA